MIASAVMGRVVEVDAFEQVLLLAGLDNQGDLPPREAPLTPEDAALYDLLLDKPVTLPRFAPRLVTASLLREVMEAEEDSPLPGRDPATGDRLTNP